MTRMATIWFLTAGTAAVLASGTVLAAEPDSCKKVRFSDVGWTDITSTTATTVEILQGPGL